MTTTAKTVVTTMNCSECGAVYGLSERYRSAREDDGASWWCPNGHGQSYHETALDDAKKALAREQHYREQAEADATRQREFREHTERRLASTQGVITRTKNRISKGVCPCCSRSFQNLKRHMGSQHPGYFNEPKAK